ncbi:MAG TPA: glycosyltransferase [Casimicrobiaceae bacterium]|nr:glycosyltransferase [Casimicrobiaceae bacterium]
MSGSSAGTAAETAIDVVVPVYNAVGDLERCVESVLAHTDCAYRLVLIDDASPDPAIAAYFDGLARRALPHVVLLRNRRNRGFPRTANRGMLLSRADVVLLNSDTIVTRGWLAALARCAASSSGIGTVTPFSNNAEICSFPKFCVNNEPGTDDDRERIRDALAQCAVPTYPSLPTGVGFCFYIKRALIDAIGVFDPAFGPGYGEENDFCLRALGAGYRSVLCDDAYVLHLGGRSFEGQKRDLGARNLALLLDRHPEYAKIVEGYIALDPLRPLRDAALTRLRSSTNPARGVLHVTQSHGGGGGTGRQVRALVAAAGEHYRHYIATAVGDDWRIEEPLGDGTIRVFDFRRRPDEPWPAFVGAIAATFGIGIVHLHSIAQSREGVIAALEALDLPYGYTVHDFSFACPTITLRTSDGMFCGGVTDLAACTRCLDAQLPFRGIDIASWRARHRALLAKSAFLIAPSQWAASMIERYFPGRPVAVIPHGTLAAPIASASSEPAVTIPFDLPDDDVPTVAVLGAIGPDKGSRRLLWMVERARRDGLRVRFALIGYHDGENGPWQSDDAIFTIHGRYEPQQLPALLAHYRVKLVAFPSTGPESFSLTLSESWSAGLPVIVPPIGALAERLEATRAGWLWTDAEWRSDDAMLARIVSLVDPANRDALAAAAALAQAVAQPTIAAMTERTLEQYDRCEVARSAGAPFLPARVRDALGYIEWIPPEVSRATPVDGTLPARGVSMRLRRAARALRRSLGRVARLTPAKIRDAMKRRAS